MNAPLGHNETAVRLALLAADARTALDRVGRGEADALDGWLAYGAALNEGRALFPIGDNERFSAWVATSNLEFGVHPAEQSAAMWAAASPEQFAAARAAGNARTVRGIHAKWQEMDSARVAAEKEAEAEAKRLEAEAARLEAEARAKAEAEARRQVQEAKDAEARKEAEARAKEEAKRKAEADKEAKAKAQASEKADKDASRAKKKADKAATGAGDNYRTVTEGNNEWYTPAEYIERARSVMGAIDLDPASCIEANETVKAARFFTEADDGLAQAWEGRVWLNPPYSRDLMPEFCEKLAAHVDSGDVTSAILVSHNNTETGWFHRLAKSCAAVCFPSKRIRFYRDENIAAPVNGQVFFYFGQDVEAFAREFGAVGWVAVPHE